MPMCSHKLAQLHSNLGPQLFKKKKIQAIMGRDFVKKFTLFWQDISYYFLIWRDIFYRTNRKTQALPK